MSVVGLDAVSEPGGHSLPVLGAGWIVLFLAAGAGAALLSRHGFDSVATSAMLMLVALVGLLGVLVPRAGGSAFGSYYPVKSLWTPYAAPVALGVAVTLWLLWRAWVSHRFAGALLATGMAAVLLFAMTPGVGQASRVLGGHVGLPALVIPMMTELNAAPATDTAGPEILVWRLMPYSADDLTAKGGDLTAQGVLPTAGYPLPGADPVFAALYDQDPRAMCTVLHEHPEAMRITGPNPERALRSLSEVGCPSSAIRAGRWHAVEMSPVWFLGTPWDEQALAETGPVTIG